ncbi:hypothetical protein V6N13_125817 [Hibiscus sabdariffa]|uniref:Uncharacterized protein n=1 Tax=Hibiscus sabdariffa TaxID=183260 RepID=A0ABR2U729_9ROSI
MIRNGGGLMRQDIIENKVQVGNFGNMMGEEYSSCRCLDSVDKGPTYDVRWHMGHACMHVFCLPAMPFAYQIKIMTMVMDGNVGILLPFDHLG